MPRAPWLGLAFVAAAVFTEDTDEVSREPRVRLGLEGAVHSSELEVFSAPDRNGDGIGDYFVAGKRADENKRLEARVELRSGADDSLLLAFATTGVSRIAVTGDLDEDGGEDLLSLEGEKPRVLMARSGRDGRALYPVELPRDARSFAALDDVDEDGIADLVVCTDSARLLLVSGRDGTRLAEPPESLEIRVGLGRDLVALDDLNGDGLRDLAVGEPQMLKTPALSRVLILSGSDLSLLREITESGKPAVDRGDLRGFGTRLARVGDLNGDGVSELAVADFVEARVEVFSPIDGDRLLHLPCPGEGWHHGLSSHGHSVLDAGDLDGDGTPDLVISNPEWNDSGSPGIDRGRAWVISGKSQEVLFVLGGEKTYDGLGRGLVLLRLEDRVELVTAARHEVRRFTLE